jgi:hypothetical protein
MPLPHYAAATVRSSMQHNADMQRFAAQIFRVETSFNKSLDMPEQTIYTK